MSNTSSDKWRFTFYTIIILVILFNPWAYKFTDSLLYDLTGHISNKEGYPTILGFIIHIIIFTLIIRYLMDMNI
jgi:hypothetical protein